MTATFRTIARGRAVTVDEAIDVALAAVDYLANQNWATCRRGLIDAHMSDDDIERVRQVFVADHAVNRASVAEQVRATWAANHDEATVH